MRANLISLAALAIATGLLAGCATGGPSLGSDPWSPDGTTAPEQDVRDHDSVQIAAIGSLTPFAIPSPPGAAVTFIGYHGNAITRLTELGLGPIAYASSGSPQANYDVFSMLEDGGQLRRLAGSAVADAQPAWSPDGSRIAFMSQRNGPQPRVFVANADGTGATLVGQPSVGEDRQPSWSPDGARIAFSSMRDANWEIYTSRLDGTDLRRITNNTAPDVSPSWSPDGSRIAFVRQPFNQGADIYSVRPDGTDLRRLTYDSPVKESPAWSPDGTQIAYQADEGGDSDIWVMSGDGAMRRRLTSGPTYDSDPDWSPDGDRIVFSRRTSGTVGNGDLLAVNADGSGLRALTQTPNEWETQPAWSPVRAIVRNLIGPTASDGGTGPVFGGMRPLIILGLDGQGLVSAVTADVPSTRWDTVSASGVPDTGAQTVGVEIRASQLSGVREDRGRGLTPRVWEFSGSPAVVSALVFLNPTTGRVSSVLTGGFTARAAEGTSGPRARLEGGSLVLEGPFASVYTSPGTDVAPVGAVSVALDAGTGMVTSVR